MVGRFIPSTNECAHLKGSAIKIVNPETKQEIVFPPRRVTAKNERSPNQENGHMSKDKAASKKMYVNGDMTAPVREISLADRPQHPEIPNTSIALPKPLEMQEPSSQRLVASRKKTDNRLR